MEEVKGCFFLHIPMATKHGTFQWPPSVEHSNGHQAWDLPLATKHGTFQWPPSMGSSIGHQTWNIPMATKHGTFQWPPNMESFNGHQAWDLPLTTKHGSTFTSFSFSLKGELGSLGGVSFLPPRSF
jgi:hypothetical protein